MAFSKSAMLVVVVLALMAVLPAWSAKPSRLMSKEEKSAFQDMHVDIKQIEGELRARGCEVPGETLNLNKADPGSYAAAMNSMTSRQEELQAALDDCIASGSTLPPDTTTDANGE